MNKIAITGVAFLAFATAALGAPDASSNESSIRPTHSLVRTAALGAVRSDAGIQGRMVAGQLVAQALMGAPLSPIPRQPVLQSPTPALTPTPMAPSADWLSYHNAATGLSFRYPPSLRVTEEYVTSRDPIQPGTRLAVALIGDTAVNPGTAVLVFSVNMVKATPETIALTSKQLHDVCPSMELGGHEAFVCVDCGRAACHWNVDILQPHECSISTLLAGSDSAEAAPPPHDGLFPLLSIIGTVHFDTSGQ